MTKILYLLRYAVIIFVATSCTPKDSIPGISPNILLILTDDMGFGDVANIGNPYIHTPNLDGLAENSIRFNYFYVSPVCAPTRASLLTGRYHQRTGVRSVTNGFETMDPNEITIAEILQEKGYQTGIFGKWHLGEYYPSIPSAQGFDEYLGFRTGHTDYYLDPTLEHNGVASKHTGHITDVLTNEALKFMVKDKSKPFFCYLAYNAPHTPLQIDSTWWQPYAEKGLNERSARVYGMVENIDQGIGKILKSLESENILDNTIVIFMSDNGPITGWKVPQEEMRYNAGLRDQKFTVYEGGIRTQCYWMWKHHWSPGATDQVAAHIDVMPTLLDLLGFTAEHITMDGINLRSVLNNPGDPINRMFFQKYSLSTLRNPAPYPGGIARKGPWKMVNGTELYNIVEDVGETLNLSESKPGILEELNLEFREWYEDISDDHNFQSVAISLGHDAENPVYLQPHHGIATGNVQFWGNKGISGERKGTHPTGVDSNWTGNWQSTGDAIRWDVIFAQPGDYSFSIMARDTSHGQTNGLKLYIDEHPVGKLESRLLNSEWAEYSLGRSALEPGNTTIGIMLEQNTKAHLEIRALIVEKTHLSGQN